MSATTASLLCGLLFWTFAAQEPDGLPAEMPAGQTENLRTDASQPDKLSAGEQAVGNGVWGHQTWTDLEGRQWSASSLMGKVVVLDFWATWCPPCLAEIPHLRALRKQYGEGLVLLGVALDSLDRRRLAAFLHRQGMAWPQIHATRGFQSEPATRFRVESVPAIRVVDPHGRLVASDLRGKALEMTVRGLISAGDGSP